jgi:hypothetical protein
VEAAAAAGFVLAGVPEPLPRAFFLLATPGLLAPVGEVWVLQAETYLKMPNRLPNLVKPQR